MENRRVRIVIGSRLMWLNTCELCVSCGYHWLEFPIKSPILYFLQPRWSRILFGCQNWRWFFVRKQRYVRIHVNRAFGQVPICRSISGSSFIWFDLLIRCQTKRWNTSYLVTLSHSSACVKKVLSISPFRYFDLLHQRRHKLWFVINFTVFTISSSCSPLQISLLLIHQSVGIIINLKKEKKE